MSIRRLRRVSVALSVMLAMLLPLAQANCALMPLRPDSSVGHADEHAAKDHDRHHQSSSTPAAPAPSDACCTCQQLPAATAPDTVTLAAPGVSMALIFPTISSIEPVRLAARITDGVCSSSPPDPSSSPQCPRSPPFSA